MRLGSLIALLAVTALTGCALSEDKVALRYVPTSSATVIEAAKEVPINVEVVDGRTSNRTVISRKINGYGMEMAAIRSTQNPAELVERALKQELRARGFAVGDAGLAVTATLNEFFNQYEVGLLTGSAVANIKVDVAVGDPNAPTFEQSFSANKTDDAFIADGANAKAALEAALGRLISQIMANSNFMDALTKQAEPQVPVVTSSAEDVTS